MAELKQSRFPIRGALICLGVAGLLLLFGLPYFAMSIAIHGEEFCPQLFQKRDFSYSRIPGSNFRISSTTLSPAVSPCSKAVLQHLPTSSQTDWQVSTVQQGSFSKEFGPKILIDQLQANNADGLNLWDAWSFRNPKHAALLWPLVQQVALKEMYFCIPDLLQNSNPTLDLETFEKNLKKICLKAAQTKIRTLTGPKDAANAVQLREWCQQLVSNYRDDPEMKELGAQVTNAN